MSATSNRIIKNTMFLYIRMGVSIVFSFFTTRILLQALGASDYGLYNVVAGSLSMLGFLSASMSSTTQRFISYAEGEGNLEKIKTIFNNALFLHNAIAAIVGLFFVLAGFVFFNGVLNIPEGRNVVAIAVYGCMIFSTVFAVTIVPYDAVLNAHENMKFYSILGIVDVLLKFIIALVVMFTKSLDQLLFYGVLMAAESWLYRFLTKRYCIRQYEEVREPDRKKYVEKRTLKEMTSFAGWNMLNIASGMIALYCMNIIINHYYGSIYNAAMGIATQLTGVLMSFSQNMQKSIIPIVMKREGAKDRSDVVKFTLIGSKFAFVIFSTLAIPVYFSLDFLLNIWLVDVPYYTEYFCEVLLLSILLEQWFVFLQHPILAEGSIRNYSVLKFGVNILSVVSSIICCSLGFEPYWVIINRLLFYVVVGGILNLYYAYKKIDLSLKLYFMKTIVPTFGAFIMIVFTSMIIKNIIDNSYVIVLLIVVSSVVLNYLISMTKDEKILFIGNLGRLVQTIRK